MQVTGNSTGAANYSSIWALRVNGDMIASQSAIEVDAAAPTGLGFGVSGIGGQSHSVATIQDVSTSPTTLAINGAHSLASIFDNSTSQNGLDLNGTYAGMQILGHGFQVEPNGQYDALGTGVAGFASIGTHTNADFISNSSTPIGFQVLGIHSGGQIVGTSFSFDASGNLSAPNASLSGVLKFGTYTSGACTVVGSTTIQTSDGTTHKVMLCS